MNELQQEFWPAPPPRPANPARESQAAHLIETDQKRSLTVAEAAATLGVSSQHILNLVESGDLLAVNISRNAEGKLKSQRIAARLERIPPADGRLLTLEEFLAARSNERPRK